MMKLVHLILVVLTLVLGAISSPLQNKEVKGGVSLPQTKINVSPNKITYLSRPNQVKVSTPQRVQVHTLVRAVATARPTPSSSGIGTSTTTSSPDDVTNENHQRELLCRLQLYVNLLSQVNQIIPRQLGNDTLNRHSDERLIFLIPLIIIWWHHIHPTEPFDVNQMRDFLDNFTGDQMAEQYQILMQMIDKLDGRQYCTGLVDDKIMESPSGWSRAKPTNLNDLDLLRMVPTSNLFLTDSNSTTLPDLSDRQSSSRGLAAWLRSLLASFETRVRGNRPEPEIDRSTTNQCHNACNNESSTGTANPTPASVGLAENNSTSGDMVISTTTEPYGWPHYNRTTPLPLGGSGAGTGSVPRSSNASIEVDSNQRLAPCLRV